MTPRSDLLPSGSCADAKCPRRLKCQRYAERGSRNPVEWGLWRADFQEYGDCVGFLRRVRG